MAHFVVISGNSGVGKSTLTRLLGERLNWTSFVDNSEANPYLTEFLEDMRVCGLHVQLFYLARHFRDSISIELADRSIVRDRSFYEGAEIYARNLYQEGKLSERDWRLYRSLYEPIVAKLPVPNLMIYLRASVPLLMRRIAKRARRNEHTYTPEYLAQLNELYERWVQSVTVCPVLSVDVDSLDFLERPQDLDSLVEQIKLKLRID